MRDTKYENRFKQSNLAAEKDYADCLEFARDQGCNTVMLTGEAEPQQNRNFLATFAKINNSLPSRFKCIEMQTTGALIDVKYLILRPDCHLYTKWDEKGSLLF